MSSQRPGWMDGGRKRPKPPPSQPARVAQPRPDRPAERIVVEVPDGPGTHRNVVIGVTLLAIMSLFSVFFWIGIGIANVVMPPEAGWSLGGGVELITLSDYLTFGRLAVGVATGALGTFAAWMIADSVMD